MKTMNAVRISGATGVNATSINGVYEPMEERSNDAPLYRKVGDLEKWIEYGAERKKEWVIKKTADKGFARGWATLQVDTPVTLEKCKEGGWLVYDGAKFLTQKDVKVSIAGLNSVRISGATGANATSVNGIYEPTEEVSNGVTIYRKVGDPNKWLEYTHLKWMVKPTKDKGTTFGWCIIDVDEITLPDKCVGKPIRVYDGSNFLSQADCKISVTSTQPIRISGATGVNATTINGVYEPTEEVANGCCLYRKIGDPEKWLEFGAENKKEWVIKKTADKGFARGWATLFLGYIALPESGKVGEWKVYDGTKFLPQKDVKVSIAGVNSIRIAGATGTNATSVNGVYEPTEEVSNGVTVYRKVGDNNKWLEYTALKWMVKPTKDKNTAYGWCILDVDQVILPEKCIGKSLRVYDGSSFLEQKDCKISIASVQPIRLSGATGVNGTSINGVYEPTDEVANGITVYRKVGDADKWLEFGAAGKSEWVVKKTADKGFARGWASLFVDQLIVPEKCKEGAWQVYDGTKFALQKELKVSIAGLNSVRISGATGPNATSVNGVYEPTEETSNGITVYKKVGDANKWLEYTALKWMVKPTKDKGTAYGWCILDVDQVILPERCLEKSLRVYDGTNFLEQKECKVSIMGTQPIRIYGTTGVNSTTVNGVYEPTDEVSNGICIYRKSGDSDKWLEYGAGGKNEWVVKKTTDKGFPRGWATLVSDALVVPEKCKGTWQIYDGTKFEGQPAVKVAIAGLNCVRISGATGTNSASVNGVYEPTDEVSNGITVYRKIGDGNKWLEYAALKWIVKPTKDKGTTYGWCIIDVDQAILPEKCVGKSVRVYDGTNFLDQKDCKVSIAGIQPVKITGAIGVNSASINGVYEPTDEVANGITVYRKVGDADKWLEFGAAGKSEWVVKKTADKGFARGWASLFVDQLIVPEKCKEGAWQVYDGTKFALQKELKVSIAGLNSVRISGATGPNATSVNGVYEPTEETSNGITVYKKVGDANKWLEYTALKWMVKPTKDKGTAYGWCIIDVDQPIIPDRCKGRRFRIYDGTEFFEQGTACIQLKDDPEGPIYYYTSTTVPPPSPAAAGRPSSTSGSSSPPKVPINKEQERQTVADSMGLTIPCMAANIIVQIEIYDQQISYAKASAIDNPLVPVTTSTKYWEDEKKKLIEKRDTLDLTSVLPTNFQLLNGLSDRIRYLNDCFLTIKQENFEKGNITKVDKCKNEWDKLKDMENSLKGNTPISYDVYLSFDWHSKDKHGRSYKEHILSIAKFFLSRGLKVFYCDSLESFQSMTVNRIQSIMKNCKVVVLCLTNSYRMKINAPPPSLTTTDDCNHHEYQYAIRTLTNKRIIPLLLDSSIKTPKDWKTEIYQATIASSNFMMDFLYEEHEEDEVLLTSKYEAMITKIMKIIIENA